MDEHLSTGELKGIIRDVPDFPKPGILFKDITPLVAHPRGFRTAVELLAARAREVGADGLVAIESRGFLFGAGMAVALGVPLQLARKAGKLPYRTVGMSYDLEYGSARIEMHVDAIERGRRYVIVDDLIATGGTAAATAQLIEGAGGQVASCLFVIELAFLDGRKLLGGRRVDSLITY
ncbi:MAG TPA: adenine phosphoribosyltransferase [Kofleriaceae bacterium]|nr:adenine phosphoribosyltransferase [Kofleriaceae bacterium]